MSQKSKTLLQLLQQHQHLEQEFDNKLPKQIADLYHQIRNNLLKQDDQLLLCQLRKLIPIDSNDQGQESSTLLCYVGCIFTALMQDKLNLEQEMDERKSRDQSEYEDQLIKLEAEIRQHIRVMIFMEQQLKLYADSTQSKLEDAFKQMEEMDEEIQQLKLENQHLVDKNQTLTQRLKNQDSELQILRNKFNNFKLSNNQERVLQQIQQPKNEQPIQINLQLEKLNKEYRHSDHYERVQTEPHEMEYYKSKNVSQKKLAVVKNQRLHTESLEVKSKAKEIQSKHNRLKTVQNASTLLGKSTKQFVAQEVKRHLSNKSYQEHKSKEAPKPKRSQHSDANNSIHSFRKTHTQSDFQQIPRPYSSIDQDCSFQKDYSMDFNASIENQQQIKKLLTTYQTGKVMAKKKAIISKTLI